MASIILETGLAGSLLLSISALVVCYFVTAVVAWYRLREIPGPFMAKFSYLWLGRVAMSGRLYYVHRDLCKRYGPLVRVGPNELSTDDPEVIRHLSAVRNTYGKDGWYSGVRFNPYYHNMISTLDIGEHDRIKAKRAPAYGGREVPELETGIDSQINTMLEVIRAKYLWTPTSKDAPLLDLSQTMSFLTMDVISCAAFGTEFGYLKHQTDLYNFLRGVHDYWPVLTVTLDVPIVRSIVYSTLFLKLFGPKTTDKEGFGALMGVTEKVVGKRLESGSEDDKDMLGSFIRHGLTRTECEVEGLFMVVAGSDTTVGTLRNTLLHIITCPAVYRKLKEEVSKAVMKGQVSSPIRFEEAKRLPYLQAVLYEGLRMRPPTPGLYPKTVPPEGDVIRGYFIPGGTAIGMNTASLMQSTAIFGPDYHIFRPERFLEVGENARAEMERVVELAFGYGRFMCAGKPIAFMELNKVYFELLRHFDLQVASPGNPWKSASYSVFVDEHLLVKVTESSM